MINLFSNYDHTTYKQVDEKEADAIAWIFDNSKNIVKIPYVFPQLKPNEIRANVMYSGICHSDILNCRGKWGSLSYPVFPGHEVIAEISLIGTDVKDFQIGDKVIFEINKKSCGLCKFCINNKKTLCVNRENIAKDSYRTYWGGWSTQIQQPADCFLKIPNNLDIVKSAALSCSGCAVYGPIKTWAKEGDRCAVIGIGGLGHLAILFLVKLGYEVTAFTHSENKHEEIHNLGCLEVILITDKLRIDENRLRFDFVLNTLPTTQYFNDILSMCAPECKYIMLGIPDFSEELKLDYKTIIFRDIILIGSLNGNKRFTEEVINFCVEKNIYPKIEIYTFEDVPRAVSNIEKGIQRFKSVINVIDYSKQHGWYDKIFTDK